MEGEPLIPKDEATRARRQLARIGCGSWIYDMPPERALAARNRMRELTGALAWKGLPALRDAVEKEFRP